MSIKPGDIVLCKIYEDNIVASESMDFEATLAFDIICQTTANAYLVKVPRDVFLKSSFILDDRDIGRYNLHKKFLGTKVVFIIEEEIKKIQSRMMGCICSRCNEACDYAEPNRLDAEGNLSIFVCYACRQNRFR